MISLEERHDQNDRRHLKQMVSALGVLCVLLGGADLVYHKHVHFDFEYWLGFYGGFGFVSCVGLVLGARLLRKLLQREEDYYDR